MDKLSKMLSYADIVDILGFKILFVLYDDLEEIEDIEELFKPEYNNCCLILIRTGPNVGHFVCITKDENNIITFVDPYGDHPDDQLKHTNIEYYPELSRLLLNHKGPIEYNNYKLQSLKKYKGHTVNTCGRHCALWMKYKDIDIDDYIKIMKEAKKYIDLDLLSVYLTEDNI